MKRNFFLIIVLGITCRLALSQPLSPDTTGLNRNLAYFTQADIIYVLDLYSIPETLSVTGARPVPRPVIIFLPKAGIKKFPCPASSFQLIGYAVISVEHSNDADILKTINRVCNFIKGNSSKYNLDPKNVGIIQQVERGYLAVIWEDGLKRLKVLSDAKVRIGVAAVDDSTFTGFRKPDNLKQVTGFFDRHLRNGIHTDPVPPDSVGRTHH